MRTEKEKAYRTMSGMSPHIFATPYDHTFMPAPDSRTKLAVSAPKVRLAIRDAAEQGQRGEQSAVARACARPLTRQPQRHDNVDGLKVHVARLGRVRAP